jgi:hypothetical protein
LIGVRDLVEAKEYREVIINEYTFRNVLNFEDFDGRKVVATTHEESDFRAFAYYPNLGERKDAVTRVILEYIEWKRGEDGEEEVA